MILTDLNAFIKRDPTMAPDPRAETIGLLTGNDTGQMTFSLSLPAHPLGAINDLDNDSTTTGGVEVYALQMATGYDGSTYMEANEFVGWPTSYSSLQTTESSGEITNGSIMVWAPDDNQRISSGFGADGRLFTADDPVMSIQHGWTVIQLEALPFIPFRVDTMPIPILKGFTGQTDLSTKDWVASVSDLLDGLEARYPYTTEKQISWPALRIKYIALASKARVDNDRDEFASVLFELGQEFNDGHVSSTLPRSLLDAELSGYIGFRLALTDTNELIVQRVEPGSDAEANGIVAGAQINQWNGQTPANALAAEPELNSESTDFARAQDRVLTLSYDHAGSQIVVTFTPPDGSKLQRVLTFIRIESHGADYAATYANRRGQIPGEQAITTRLLPDGNGYLRITTFDSDPIAMRTSFKQAIDHLKSIGAIGLVLDMRGNTGGYGSLAREFAGYFTTEAFTLGDFVIGHPDGAISRWAITIFPSSDQWNGTPVSLVVDYDCASACEMFSLAMAHDPTHIIVGYTPTAGMLAAICIWSMPTGLSFQASCVGIENGDTPLLEGTGLAPTVLVPDTAENLLNTDDTLLQIAIQQMNIAMSG